MLNWATSRDENEARDLKSLAKRLLRAIVDAIEAEGWEAPPARVEETYRGRRLGWRLSARAGSACGDCACDRFAWEPEGEGLPFDFCPACWSLRGGDRERSVTFDVRLGLEKSARDLPPGMTMTLRVGGEGRPVGPRSPATEAEKRAALEAYAASAVRRLEIGRQLWMARMSFEGINGTRQDWGEARRWYERAATRGSGEALTRLGLMALEGLGEPVDEARAASLCRKAAERGFPPAQTGMGRLCWDGRGVAEDPAAAVAWWRLSAARKDPEAQTGLAVALIRGRGTERDAEQGMALLEEAARAGYEEAQELLERLDLEPG